MRRNLRRYGLLAMGLVGMAAMLAPSVAVARTQSQQASSLAAYSASFGYRGHAGLYAYGMAFDPTDGTVLVGDVWNYRVLRFSQGGSKVGTIAHFAPKNTLGGVGAPFGVAADGAGDVWVADWSNARIVEFSHTGTWIQTIGLGGSPGENYPMGCGKGSMTAPTDITVDPASQYVFVTDSRCGNVYVFTASGAFVRQFTWKLGYTPVPRGIGIDSSGHVYVAEFRSKLVYQFDEQGNQLMAFAAPTHPTDMSDVRGLAVDNVNSRVYVTAAQNQKVVVFSTSGSYITTWSSPGGGAVFNSIRYVTTDSTGNVYVSDMFGYRVWKFDSNGNQLSWSYPPAPPPNGGWNQVDGIAVDSVNGNLYGVDTFANRVQRFGTSGGQSCASQTSCAAFQLAFGQRGPTNPNAPGLNYPHEGAVDHGSNAFFMDGTDDILRFDLDGNYVSGWGNHGSAPGQFKNGPQGLVAVPSGVNTGTIYAVDQNNCRLQVFDYSGNLLSYMGSCGNGTDQMMAPRALDVDTVHNVAYVADTVHSRIAEWDLTTKHIVATFSGPVGSRGLNFPVGVALDPTRTWLYIGDTGNNRVVRVSTDLSAASAVVVTTGADTPQGSFGGPEWLTFSGYDGRLFVSDNNQVIYAFTITG